MTKKEILEAIPKVKKIFVSWHMDPKGDCGQAGWVYLETSGKEVEEVLKFIKDDNQELEAEVLNGEFLYLE